MTVRKNSWIRRVIAAGMAMGIVVSTTLPSLADGVAGDGYGSQITVEDGLAGTDSAEKAEAAAVKGIKSGCRHFNFFPEKLPRRFLTDSGRCARKPFFGVFCFF